MRSGTSGRRWSNSSVKDDLMIADYHVHAVRLRGRFTQCRSHHRENLVSSKLSAQSRVLYLSYPFINFHNKCRGAL
jgi:hypothetical protein